MVVIPLTRTLGHIPSVALDHDPNGCTTEGDGPVGGGSSSGVIINRMQNLSHKLNRKLRSYEPFFLLTLAVHARIAGRAGRQRAAQVPPNMITGKMK